MTDPKAPTPAPAPDPAERPRTAPRFPEEDASKEEWEDFRGIYETWVEKATDAELLAEMAALPTDGRPLSPAERWMYHECEVRRRRPKNDRAAGRGKGRG